MKKMLFTLAIAGIMIVGSGITLAATPHGLEHYRNTPPSHHRHHNPPPPPRHHHHHNPPPPPIYYNYYAPIPYYNQVISINNPYGSYYFSTPYYTYPYGYYPNKTLTVRTKHVLFSI